MLFSSTAYQDLRPAFIFMARCFSVFILWFSYSYVGSYKVLAQNQNNQWHFGAGGAVDFNVSPPAFVPGSQIGTAEGSASIADRNTGALLFYTDGITVWNALNQPMPNGTGLLGGTPSMLSSTTAAVIVPKPGSSNLYYIVTIDEQSSTNGLRYSVVDMNLNGGTGAVVAGQKNIFLLQTTSEKLEVVPASDGNSLWLIAHDTPGNSFYAYKITSAGIQTTPVISSVGNEQQNGAGHMKINRQFNRMAMGRFPLGSGLTTTIELFDFNNSTGVFSNPFIVNYNFSVGQIYGLEFSPNGRFLYVSELGQRLVQYDVSLPTTSLVENSAYVVSFASSATLQLGPNGKIYINAGGLNVINCPDNPGESCGFQVNGVPSLGGGGGYGLPKWVFYPDDTPLPGRNTISFSDSCFGNTTRFTLRDTTGVSQVTWSFGDPGSGTGNVATGLSVGHVFSQSGLFNIRAIVANTCGTDTIRLNGFQVFNCNPVTITGIKISGDTCNSLTLALQATGGVSSSPYFKWNFGDPASGSNDTITITGGNSSAFPTHTFSSPGIYNVCVTFQEPGFQPQTICRTFSVKRCCEGTIQTSDSCLANRIPFSFSTGAVVSEVRWDFGDPLSGANNVASGLSVGHTFSSAATYTVKAIVTAACGTFTREISKTVVPCQASCTGPIFFSDTCLANGTVFGFLSDFTINAIAWNFGDPLSGSANVSADINPRHFFTQPGKYRITATVNASCGLFVVSDSVTIISCPPPCEARISANDTCLENGTGFRINSFYPVLSARWNFGDSLVGGTSNTSEEVSPIHLFRKSASYLVSVQVELSCGTKALEKTLSISTCNCKAFVPNLITADGNGQNDFFEVSIPCTTKRYRLTVFNRWGMEVFASENPAEKWKSNSVIPGTYYYSIDLQYDNNTSELLKGWVNVVN